MGAIQARRRAVALCEARWREFDEEDTERSAATQPAVHVDSAPSEGGNETTLKSEEGTAKKVGEGTTDKKGNSMMFASSSSDVGVKETPVCLGFRSQAFFLLSAYACGRPSFTWELRGRGGSLERVELQKPVHPFQLSWRLQAPHMAGQAASGYWRNPTGHVLACPTRAVHTRNLERRLKASLKMELEGMDIGEESKNKEGVEAKEEERERRWTQRLERFAVFCSAQSRQSAGVVDGSWLHGGDGELMLEGLSVLPNEHGANALPLLLILAFARPQL